MTTTLKDIRSTFLNYFEKNGHKILPSSSLVPNNDPTLMFTNSGMVQFKNIFTGNESSPFKRIATSQKCVRAGGKHNDLDSVGYDVRHHTFFEMLGNFSFNDYFKEEAINFAWEIVTKEFNLPKNKLAVTVFHTDDVAYDIWKKVSGLPEDRIIRIATKDNFWQMGDTGPCGYCSEIFYDHGEKVWGGLPGTPEENGDRWIEIWNLVFDEFEDLPSGERINLKQPCIDTGMGLERISAILQGVHSNYEIDIFQNLIKAVAELVPVEPQGEFISSYNVITDHLRAMCFLIADGVLPSNEGRGYVLRRIMRRAMRHAHILKAKEPIMYKLLPALQKEMGEAYPELYRVAPLISETLKTEESKFIKTLDNGLRLLDAETSSLQKGDVLSGQTAFKLYDTYGFPLDLTQDALKLKGIEVDTQEFNEAMEKQRQMARAAWSGSGDAGTDKIWFELKEKLGATEFLGYNQDQAIGQITALVVNEQEVSQVQEGDFYLIANQTPFYGESGGQAGDIGYIESDNFNIKVTDVKKRLDGLYIHICSLVSGEVKVGDTANFKIDVENRNKTRANHSVTHLVHTALREVLGKHVTQKGSSVNASRMRFDISHPKQISKDELKQVELMVNNAIRQNYKCTTTLMTPQEAVEIGAMALFGEKYGEQVRVVTFEKDGQVYSRELCGGTHVSASGQIGYFHIVSESALATGIRRIECITGNAAESYVYNLQNKLQNIEALLKIDANNIENKIEQLIEDKKKLELEIYNLKKNAISGKNSTDKTEQVNGINFVGKILEGVNPKELKSFVDEILKNVGSAIVVLGAKNEGKASIVVGLSSDLTSKYSAVDFVKQAATIVGGNGGGGRPDMAQAGGTMPEKLPQAIESIKNSI